MLHRAESMPRFNERLRSIEKQVESGAEFTRQLRYTKGKYEVNLNQSHPVFFFDTQRHFYYIPLIKSEFTFNDPSRE